MGKPITTTSTGICFAFPDVCLTPAPIVVKIPIPYPNIGQISDTQETSEPDNVFADSGTPIVVKGSLIEETTGDEAGSDKGVTSGTIQGKVEYKNSSSSVKIGGKGIVRMFDITDQNDGNAKGIVLGGVPTILVGD